MSTTGTYSYAPALSDLIVAAYGRCQIRRTELGTEHLKDAAIAANLLQSEWANKPGINLWTVELVSQVLSQGTSNYSVDPSTVLIMAAYIETGVNPPQDRIILSVSRDEYASYPNKTQQAPPTVYWYDKLINPTITLWPVPDADATYTLKYYRARQMQDAAVPGGIQSEIPYRFLEAYTAALAEKLAELYKPELLAILSQRAAAAWERAAERDVENAPTYIMPSVGAYYRGAA